MSVPELALNLAAFRELEAGVGHLLARGDLERAAAQASAAARFAWLSHPGRHASPRIEAALAEIGRRAFPLAPLTRRRGHLLHVISEATVQGGHVALAERWIRREPPGRVLLALTRNARAVTPELARALEEAEADAVRLGGRRDGLLARAAALRDLAAGAESVTLHVHPDDVVPALAFASWHDRPPVAHVNHADHCFWAGLGAADLLIQIRDYGTRLAARRRGVPEERSAVLPLPIDPRPAGSRARARAALEIEPAAVVLLMAASDYKLSGQRPHLLDLIEPVLAERPDTVLLAAGPWPGGRFAQAQRRTGGRVRALGHRDDLPVLMRAADVFIDAFPCSSLTAALEAAAAGLPVLSFQPARPGAALLDTDAPALGEHHLRAAGPDAYRALLTRLVDEPSWRERTGAASGAAVAATHSGEGWDARVDRVRLRLASAHASGPPALDPPEEVPPDDEDLALLDLHARAGVAIGAGAAISGAQALLGRPDAPDLSIVIVAEEREALLTCLDGAVAACESVDRVEAVVIDNATGDGTENALAAMSGDLRWARLGVRASIPDALALGGAMADGDLVLLVGQDVRLAASVLESCRAALARLPGEEAVAPEGAGDPWSPGDRGVLMLARGDALRAAARVVARSVPAAGGGWEPVAPGLSPDAPRSARASSSTTVRA